MKKKILWLGLSLLLVASLVLASCGVPEDDDVEEIEPPAEEALPGEEEEVAPQPGEEEEVAPQPGEEEEVAPQPGEEEEVEPPGEEHPVMTYPEPCPDCEKEEVAPPPGEEEEVTPPPEVEEGAAPELPKPGEWTISSTGSNEFSLLRFTVNPDSTGIAKVSYYFEEFECMGGQLFAELETSREPVWPITGSQFTIDLDARIQDGPDWLIVFEGRFNEASTHASGTWEISAEETTCQAGTWEASPGS